MHVHPLTLAGTLVACALFSSAASAQTPLTPARLTAELRARQSNNNTDPAGRLEHVGTIGTPAIEAEITAYLECRQRRSKLRYVRAKIERRLARLGDPYGGWDPAEVQSELDALNQEANELASSEFDCPQSRADFVAGLFASYGEAAIVRNPPHYSGERVRHFPPAPPPDCTLPFSHAISVRRECRSGISWDIQYNLYDRCTPSFVTEASIIMVVGPDGGPVRCAPETPNPYPDHVTLPHVPQNFSSAPDLDEAAFALGTTAGQTTSFDALAGVASWGDVVSIDSTLMGNAALRGTTIEYTPPPGYAGADELVFTVTDDLGQRSSTAVRITVAPLHLIAPTMTRTPPPADAAARGGTPPVEVPSLVVTRAPQTF